MVKGQGESRGSRPSMTQAHLRWVWMEGGSTLSPERAVLPETRSHPPAALSQAAGWKDAVLPIPTRASGVTAIPLTLHVSTLVATEPASTHPETHFIPPPKTQLPAATLLPTPDTNTATPSRPRPHHLFTKASVGAEGRRPRKRPRRTAWDPFPPGENPGPCASVFSAVGSPSSRQAEGQGRVKRASCVLPRSNVRLQVKGIIAPAPPRGRPFWPGGSAELRGQELCGERPLYPKQRVQSGCWSQPWQLQGC